MKYVAVSQSKLEGQGRAQQQNMGLVEERRDPSFDPRHCKDKETEMEWGEDSRSTLLSSVSAHTF